MKINEELKERRLERNINQKELSLKTKLSQSAISYWENGKRIPNIEECIKLANFYKISLDELVGRDFF